MKLLIATSLAILLVAACSTGEPRSVEWFSQHETEREAVLADCARNAVPSSVECLNVQKAEDSLALKRRGYVRPRPVDFTAGE